MTGYAVIPSHDASISIPATPPSHWALRTFDGLIVWGFLIEPDPRERGERPPWLVVAEQPGVLGMEKLAVPRLMPECEWETEASADAWHRRAFDGSATPVRCEESAIESYLQGPSARGRRISRKNPVEVAVGHDLRCRTVPDIVERRVPRDPDFHELEERGLPRGHLEELRNRSKRKRENERRNVYRDLQTGRELLAALGAVPWVAFERGRLPNGWWHDGRFFDALVRWHRHSVQLGYRAMWEEPPQLLSPGERAVYVLLASRADGNALRPETMALVRAALEDDARATDAFTEDQWVARLDSAARPGRQPSPVQVLVDFPVLHDAWSRVRAGDPD